MAVGQWTVGGGARLPIRAALIQYWVGHLLLWKPVPPTGGAALRAETAWAPATWTRAFVSTLAAEAVDAGRPLLDLERAWLDAHAFLPWPIRPHTVALILMPKGMLGFDGGAIGADFYCDRSAIHARQNQRLRQGTGCAGGPNTRPL